MEICYKRITKDFFNKRITKDILPKGLQKVFCKRYRKIFTKGPQKKNFYKRVPKENIQKDYKSKFSAKKLSPGAAEKWIMVPGDLGFHLII